MESGNFEGSRAPPRRRKVTTNALSGRHDDLVSLSIPREALAPYVSCHPGYCCQIGVIV